MSPFVSPLLSLLLSMSVQAQPNVSGAWAMTVVDFGVPNTMRLVLKQDGDKLTGTLGNQTLEGTLAGVDITFKVGNREARGKLTAGRLAGQVTQGGRTLEWSAERLPQRPAKPRTHTFEPTKFELYFTSRVDPVLRIAPGDTVKTWSVGADGVDAKGERRSPGGNPQTGPFYVEGAMPGDTLVVRLNRLRTNRAWAVSGSRVMPTARRAGPPGRPEVGRLVQQPLDNRCRRRNRTARAAARRAEGFHGSLAADARLRGGGARRAVGDSHDRFRTIRRQHGLQRAGRGNDGVPAGESSRRAALRRRWPRRSGGWRADRRCTRNVDGHRVHRGSDRGPGRSAIHYSRTPST